MGLRRLVHDQARRARRVCAVGPAEQGFAAGAQWEIGLGDIKVTPLVEYLHFWKANGVAGARRHFPTTALSAEYEGWSAAVARTLRNTSVPGAACATTQSRFRGGYTFDNGFGIEVGYSFRNEDGVGTHTIGALLTHELSFGLGGKQPTTDWSPAPCPSPKAEARPRAIVRRRER